MNTLSKTKVWRSKGAIQCRVLELLIKETWDEVEVDPAGFSLIRSRDSAPRVYIPN